MQAMQVHVKQSHILSGRRSSRFHCPVALAIKEQMPDATVKVQLDLINIDGIDYVTPERAANFMGSYDRSKKDVPPIRFSLKEACPICKHPKHEGKRCNRIIGKKTLTHCSCLSQTPTD